MGPKRAAIVAVWIAAVAIHVALLAYSFPPGVVLGELPFGSPDYQTHYHQTSTLMRALSEHGRLWIYDPGMLAGFPAGLVFDVDNESHFWWTWSLTRVGVPTAAAFNLFVVFVSLVAPAGAWVAAWALRYDAGARATAFALAVGLWHLDATAHFCRVGGMISFVACAAVAVAVLGLYARMLEERARAWRWWAGVAITLPLALWIHAWAFAILAVPMLALYVGRARARALGFAGHGRVWALAGLALTCNLYWLLPALRHADLMTPSVRVGQATPRYFVADYLGLVIDAFHTGPPEQHTLLRFLALFAALAGLYAWRRAGDPRFVLGAVTLAWLGLLTYCGALVPGLRATEPYRFAAPMAFWSGLIAAPWLVETLAWRRLSRETRWAGLAAAILLAPRLVQELLYFVPELERVQDGAALTEGGARPIAARPAGGSFRFQPVSPTFERVARALDRVDQERAEPGADREAGPGEGRVLVQWWPLAEYLAWATPRPIVGGFPDRRLVHESANLYRLGTADRRRAPGELAAYLARYNIRYVVTRVPADPLMVERADLLAPGPVVDGLYQVFTVRAPAGYLVRGQGRVRASLGRVALDDVVPSAAGDLVLRFHYLRELECRPSCRIEQVEIPGDPAGFIRVLGAPRLPTSLELGHPRP